MKRVLTAAILICFILSLAACGRSSGTKTENIEKDATKKIEKEVSDKFGKDVAEEVGEMIDDVEYTTSFESDIVWDSEKMGGMPQPEGTSLFMEMDLSETLGADLAYSYSVTGMTKEVFEEYTKLAAEKFPKIIENQLSDTEGTFLATTEDSEKNISVKFIEGNVSFIQYIE